MSFRARILVLVAAVAVTAVGATAYLAFRTASDQLTDAATADAEVSQQIVDQLIDHGSRQGSWDGVDRVVAELADQTGQRIQLVSDASEVLADSDSLDGRPARDVVGSPLLVDPRPSFSLPLAVVTQSGIDPAGVTVRAIVQYRSGVALARCLSRAGVGVAMDVNDYGVPDYSARDASAGDSATADRCYQDTIVDEPGADIENQVQACGEARADLATGDGSPRDQAEEPGPAATVVECLERVFVAETVDVAPRPLRLYLGAEGERRPSLAAGPVVAAAALVGLLALAGTVLLSRQVLRPISALTNVSRRIGGGDLAGRVPVQGHDELAQLAESFNDMAAALQQAEDRQRRLIADVAHELRTPLANLRGYLEALKDGVLPPDPQLFADLHRESNLQQRIVDDLQDLALAEAGALTYHRSAVDIAELLASCVTAHQAGADAAGVTLRAHVDRPVVVDADPDRLRQAIGNLLGNSVRATPAGGSVTLEAGDGDGAGWATIAVRDTGTGIAANDLPHIFDRFWRADPARSRDNGGSGLGLAITRQIVDDHGGEVTATSEPGIGTTITITLPARSTRR